MKKQCIKCGSCCKTIALGLTPQQIRDKAKLENKSCQFILKNWCIVPENVAFNLNPYIEHQFKNSKRNRIFYVCQHFNYKTNLCNIHNKRPDLCKGFPLYDKNKLPKMF